MAEQSFEEVAEELSAPLRQYLSRMVGDPTAAEDLLQETLLKIARGLPGFEGRSSLKTWAFTIATRVAKDHFRRPEVRTGVVDVDETEELVAVGPEVEERIVVEEMTSCIREVIDSLPQDYRVALVLHDLEGLTAAETAQISGCSLATAKIRIHRARKRLQQALRRDCTFYQDRKAVLRCDRKADAPDSSEQP